MQASRVAMAVGLDLQVQCFPAGGQLRDAAHVALIRRFLARVSGAIPRTLEAPIGPGDLRAWDVLLQVGSVRIAVAAETRLRDLQALVRRENQKLLDGHVDLLILLVADTRHNRATLAEFGDVIAQQFPLGTRQVMAALRRGGAPRRNGIAVM